MAHHIDLTADARLTGLLPSGWQLVVYDNFEEVSERWYQAQLVCPSYLFQTYDWQHAWYMHLGQRQGWQCCIVELRDAAGQTGMLFPLGIVSRKEGRVLSFMGGEVTDYNAPLVNPSFLAYLNKDNLNQLWLRIVNALPAVDVVVFKRMPSKFDTLPNPMIWLDGMQATEQAHAAMLTPTYVAFQEPRSAKMFADTRRQSRRLAEAGEMVIAVQVDEADHANVIAALAQQKSRRWQETGSRDLFAEIGYLAFYQYLATHGIAGGRVLVSGLKLNGQWIATHWGVYDKTRFYWLMPGYENDTWAKYSPGRVLLDAVVQWAIAEKLAVFDLTVGDEAYKRQWADQVLPLYAGSYGVSLRGKTMITLQRAYRACYTRARESERLRAFVRRLRGRAPASK